MNRSAILVLTVSALAATFGFSTVVSSKSNDTADHTVEFWFAAKGVRDVDTVVSGWNARKWRVVDLWQIETPSGKRVIATLDRAPTETYTTELWFAHQTVGDIDKAVQGWNGRRWRLDRLWQIQTSDGPRVLASLQKP